MWDAILFDLDGTLTDPKEGITNAAAAALRHFGIREDPDKLTAFIGPPLDESFAGFYGFTPEQIVTATGKFREYFSRQGWRENVPYPGIGDLLRELKDAGKTLLVATSKPEEFAVRILEHFGLAQYFRRICGAPMESPEGAKKAAVIRNALAFAQGKAVMVGDRRHDVAGARETGLPCVGVLYGYGDREELEKAGAEFVAEDLAELRKILLSDSESAGAEPQKKGDRT